MADYLMPSLGADMDEGTLVEWLVQPGDAVHRGQVVAVVDTAKSAIEVEVFEDGVIAELLVPVGSTVPVGTPLARIDAAEPGAAESGSPKAAPPAVAPRPDTAPGPHPGSVSPVVRHHAHELGVDLGTVRGTGRDGTPTRADVDVAARAQERPRVSPYARRRAYELGVDASALAAAVPGAVVHAAQVETEAAAGPVVPAAPAVPQPPAAPVSGASSAPTPAEAMRAAIGQLMARSKREIPHYYLQASIDLAPALGWLAERNSGRPPSERVIPAAVLLKAAARAVREVPDLNGFYVDGRFDRSEHVHLGVAVALRGGGLVAPAIHDADTLELEELMAALKDLVARARSGRLRGSQMSDPTITVTNLGEQGAELVHGVIYPPQVALVGFGRIVERPWAVDGMLGVHPVTIATLAADHRVTDGRMGSRYLAALESWLSRPEEL